MHEMFQFDNSAYEFYVHSVCRVGGMEILKKEGNFVGRGYLPLHKLCPSLWMIYAICYFYSTASGRFKMNKVLPTLFSGLYDPGSVLFALSETPHIVKVIWQRVKELYQSHIWLPVKYKYLQRKIMHIFMGPEKFFIWIPLAKP